MDMLFNVGKLTLAGILIGIASILLGLLSIDLPEFLIIGLITAIVLICIDVLYGKGFGKAEEKELHLGLYVIIVLVGIFALFIHLTIMWEICSNCVFLTMFICILGFLPAILIGLAIFFLIRKTKFAKHVNGKTVTIICIIMSLLIIMPAVVFYYDTVPPEELVNYWLCDADQDIYYEIDSIKLIYDNTCTLRTGRLSCKFPDQVPAFYLDEFKWEYDRLSKEITMTSSPSEDWELTLRLDVDLVKGEHYMMTTYYVSDTNFTLFDATLFDGTSWTGALD